MNINFEYYKVFYYVARYGSMSLAAERLMNNQSNVSRIIKKLEQSLEIKLFERTKSGTVLTENGRILYEKVKTAIELVEEAESEVNPNKETVEGNILLGISEVSIRKHLVPIIKEYRKQFPHVTVKIIYSISNQQNLKALKENKVDMAIISDDYDLPAGVKATRLIDSELYAVAGNEFEELKGRKVSLAELAGYPLVYLCKGTHIQNLIDQLFKKNNIEAKPIMEITTYDQVTPMLYSNLAVGIVPQDFYLGDEFLPAAFRIDVEGGLPKTSTCYVKRIDSVFPRYKKELEKMLLHYSEYNFAPIISPINSSGS